MEKKSIHFTSEGALTALEVEVDSIRFRLSRNEEIEAEKDNQIAAIELADWIYDNLTNADCRAIVDRLSIHLGI